MITYTCHIPHPLKREGITQADRVLPALGADGSNDYIALDEKTVSDHLKQTAAFAKFVTYYSLQNNPDGTWQPFFEELFDFSSGQPQPRFTSLESLEAQASVSPHLALLIAFIKLLHLAKPAFNNLKTAHLQFFYKTVLGLLPTPATPDKVALVFTPEKNAAQTLVPAGTVVKAGKDNQGKALFYKTTEALVVNSATVAELKTIFVKKDAAGRVQGLYAATDAPLQNRVPHAELTNWKTFGTANEALRSTVGFAIASPLFNLKEGRRRISIQLPGITTLPQGSLVAEYTTAKGWARAEIESIPAPDSGPSPMAQGFLFVRLDAGLPPMLPYSEAVHKAGIAAPHPVLRITLNNQSDAAFSAGYEVLNACRPSTLKITVTVAGVKSLVLQNDLGSIDPVKPFQPFGPVPVAHKSTLYIGSPDVFNRYLQSFHLSINWKGVPGNLSTWYAAYGNPVAGFSTQWQTFTQGHPPGKVAVLTAGNWQELTLNAGTTYKSTRHPKKSTTANTFKPVLTGPATHDYTAVKAYTAEARDGFIKLQSGFDYGHRWYANLLATAMIQKVKDATVVLPNAPYTPEFNSLHVDYTASGSISFGGAEEHRFYHLHPFGFAAVTTPGETVIPLYEDEGNLLIGLDQLTAPQPVSLLVGLQPDSGNPDVAITPENRLRWATLSGNQWLPLSEQSSLQSNTTHGFTTTGLIKLVLPPTAISYHSILKDNQVWIKASVPEGSNAYPLCTAVYTQGVEAVFDNRDNDPSHLALPLPAGTITKPDIKLSGIKTISQPYASSDGYMTENEPQFATRVSERLRHKGRAWSIADFERLLLNEFPQVYKIKCISHTDVTAEYSIGKTLVVALPDPAHTAYQNPLMPRLPKGVLEDMKSWIKRYTSPFAAVDVVNPHYEALRVECSIKLRPAYNNEAFYSTLLKQELSGFLAPWSVSGAAVQFGNRLYQSGIINFIEERPYVDYITAFAVFKTGVIDTKMGEAISASSESSVLTSAEAALHLINTAAVC